MRAAFIIWLGLSCAACLVDRLGDGAGFGCGAAEDCPAPYVCEAGLCRRASVPPKDVNVVVAAAGIACDPSDPDFVGGAGTSQLCRAADSAALASEQGPDAVLPLGNLQLIDGAEAKFSASYALQWGKGELRTRSFPVPGPAEYGTPGAAGFFAAFPELRTRGEGKGYYSFELGPWHLIALNSACEDPSVGGCGPSSPQGRWLAADLAAHPSGCALAYLYEPRFSSSGSTAEGVRPLWEQLHAAGVELVLSGGTHYERFAPLTPAGALDEARGIRSFLVGTGGARLGNVTPAAAHSERVGASHGVLRLTLQPGGYVWRFVAAADVPLEDRGEGTCH